MKKIRKILIAVLCMLLAAGPLQMAAQPVIVEAAPLKTISKVVRDKKTQKIYPADSKGKRIKLTNCWARLKSNTSVRYYFGKDGAAYAAKKISGVKYNFITKKIGSYYYGFNTSGRMIKGTYCSVYGKLYYFSTKTGRYDKNTTKKYRAAVGYRKNAATARKYFGRPGKTAKSSTCFAEVGYDLTLTYSHFKLLLYKNGRTEIVLGVDPV